MTERASDRRFQTLLFLVCFSVYLRGLCPTIYVGDTGELTTAAHVLGVAHPTGYPLYLLFAKAMMLVPLDNIAARANLFSALCFSLAMAVLYRCWRFLGLHPFWAVLAALPLGLTRTFWEEATVGRVYGLNLFFIVLLLRFLVSPGFSLRQFLAVCFISGLALGNHLQLLFTAVPAVLVALFGLPRQQWIRGIGTGLLLAGLGGSGYLYMPVRSVQNPVMNWGMPSKAASFMSSVTRSTYWYKAEGFNLPLLGRELAETPPRLDRQTVPVVAVLSAAGLILLVIRRPDLGLVLGATAAANIGMLVLHGSEFDLFMTDRYHIPLLFVIFFGFAEVIRLLMRWTGFRRVAAAGLCLLIPMLVIRHYGSSDRSAAFLASDFGFNIEMILPPGATMMTVSDSASFSLAYRRYVECSRPDVTLIHRTVAMFRSPPEIINLPLSSPPRGPLEQRLIMARNTNVFSIDLTNIEWMPEISAIPAGFIHRFVPSSWRFQKLPDPGIYFITRWVHRALESDKMIDHINILYRRGAAHRWKFLNTIENAEKIRSKIRSGEASPEDYRRLAGYYRSSGLSASADHVDRLIEQRFPPD